MSTNDFSNKKGSPLEVLSRIASGTVDLIYIDPPFYMRMPGDPGNPIHDPEFLEPKIQEENRLLMEVGTMYVHLDYEDMHPVKVLLDSIFGRPS